jgi:hypothetical protein
VLALCVQSRARAFPLERDPQGTVQRCKCCSATTTSNTACKHVSATIFRSSSSTSSDHPPRPGISPLPAAAPPVAPGPPATAATRCAPLAALPCGTANHLTCNLMPHRPLDSEAADRPHSPRPQRQRQLH